MRRTRPRRTRITALATLAMLNLFTLAAGVAVARMLPPRLAALRIPVAAVRPVLLPGTVLPPVAAGTAGTGSGADPGSLPTAAGLAAMLGSTLPAGETGPQVGLEVADARNEVQMLAEGIFIQGISVRAGLGRYFVIEQIDPARSGCRITSLNARLCRNVGSHLDSNALSPSIRPCGTNAEPDAKA